MAICNVRNRQPNPKMHCKAEWIEIKVAVALFGPFRLLVLRITFLFT